MYKEVVTVTGKIEQAYEWSAGIAGSRFLIELRDNGRLVGTRCWDCNHFMIPPRTFCERCFRPTDEWEVASETGVVNTFCVAYLGVDATRLKEPVILAVIDLDGGGSIFHRLGEVDPKDVKIGLRVRAVFKPKEERVGSILDLAYFKPEDQ